MTLIQIILLSIIVAMAAYIIYLHTIIVRKNLLIDSIIRKLSGSESTLDPEEIKAFMRELDSLRLGKRSGDEKLMSEESLSFIFEDVSNSKVFIHYTMDESVAQSIMNEGFKFAESFHKTALPVSGDKLDLSIKHQGKRYYGDYIVVISISDEIIRHYADEIEKAGIKDLSYENILTEIPETRNENQDIIYLLPGQYIKGYINYVSGKIVFNPGFNPRYSSEGFSNNLKRIKSIKYGH